MALVSVVMPVYNGERFLADAIESILAQTYTDFELLIVDDGSTDASAEIIRAYENRDRRIRFFQLQRNMGQAATLNRGIANATGKFITIMDCDDESLPQRLEKQVEFLQSNPEIGALGTGSRVVNEDLATLFDYEVPQQHALIALNLFFGASFVGATVMLRREMLASAGGFETGRRRSVDLELWLRLLSETRIKFANLPENLYIYRRHEQAMTFNLDAKGHAPEREVRGRMLRRLWNEAPERTIDRFYRLRTQQKLSWAERRAVKQDIKRLIESMIAHKWVEPEDRPLLINEMNRRMEQASPRLWQQFSHWRRHHFQ